MKITIPLALVVVLAGMGLNAGILADDHAAGGKTLDKDCHHPRHFHRAGGYGRGKHEMKFWRGRTAAALEISEEQQSQIKAIRQATRDETAPLRKQIRENRRAEREAFQAGADVDQLKELATESAVARVDLMIARRETQQKLLAILTPEQQSRLEELRAERKARREERRQNCREKQGKKPDQAES